MRFRNVLLVLKREYMQRVKSPGFIIGTIVGVLGLIALGFLPTLINAFDDSPPARVAVVDPRNLVYSYLEVLARPTPTPQPGQSPTDPSNVALPMRQSITFVRAEAGEEPALIEQVNNDELGAYLVVNGDQPSNATFDYYVKDTPGNLESAQLISYLSAALTQGKLQEFGLSPDQAQSLFSTPQMEVAAVEGAELKDVQVVIQSTALVYVLLILLYATTLMYGLQVAMGVVEEKSSRVMEMLITAVRPIELLTGKVLGVGLAGLTQYAVWVASGLVLLLISSFASSGDASAGSGMGLNIAAVPAGTLVSFLVFFVLGYALFAAMYAALGSLVNRVEDVNNVTAPLTIVMVAVYLVSLAGLANPDADHIRVLSFVPFFTPMLMFLRVAVGSVAAWEVIVGVLLLVLTTYLLTWLAAKIYRVGVLLYGKRPSVREIARLLRTT